MTVLYEDNHIIAVNKTCSEIVQGDKTGDTPLSEIVKAYIKEKYNKPGEVFLGVPHRLDRPTSGVVLFARTSKALTRLNEMFREKSSYSEAVLQQSGLTAGQPGSYSVSGPTAKRSYSVSGPTVQRSIIKTYWAIVQGCPKQPEGRLENYLIRNEKRPSHLAELRMDCALLLRRERQFTGKPIIIPGYDTIQILAERRPRLNEALQHRQIHVTPLGHYLGCNELPFGLASRAVLGDFSQPRNLVVKCIKRS